MQDDSSGASEAFSKQKDLKHSSSVEHDQSERLDSDSGHSDVEPGQIPPTFRYLVRTFRSDQFHFRTYLQLLDQFHETNEPLPVDQLSLFSHSFGMESTKPNFLIFAVGWILKIPKYTSIVPICIV